jgi:hypothetical protein
VLAGFAASLFAVGSGAASAGDHDQRRGTSHAQPPPEQRTYPRVAPRRGRVSTAFAAYFTLRSRPGHQGVMETTYRVAVARAGRSSARCAPPSPDAVQTGVRGSIARVPLAAPGAGWCRGRYRVTVFLQRGPYCPKPGPGEPPQPCPEFATQDLDTGEAHFTVVSLRP